MSSRERELEALVAQLKRRVHTAAIDGLEQGLGYLLTKRLDLTGESFGAMDDAELLRIARRCPELEALFVPEDSAMDQRLADTLRRGQDAPCPRLRCARLGREISEAAFVAVEEQYTRSDTALGAAIQAAALSEGIPGEQPAVPPASCKVLDLTGEDFSRLTDDGLGEIAEFCTDTTVLFLGASTRVSQVGLDAFRERCAGVRVVHLGREIFPATALVNLLGSYAETKRLNLAEFVRLSARGLREILSLCPEVTAVFTTADDKITPQELADISASCRTAKCMLLGREVDEPTIDSLHAQYEGSKMLDLAGPEFSRLTAAGLSELAGLFPDLQTAFFRATEPLPAPDVQAWGQQSGVQTVLVGSGAIATPVQTQAMEAYQTLLTAQKNVKDAARQQQDVDTAARDEARQAFITASGADFKLYPNHAMREDQWS
eukprot:COSAG05_NODE_2078_length_3573_cov_13.642694_2_plen_432_part_00